LSSNFVPVKTAGGNSSEADRRGTIVVGGKAPDGDKSEMNRLNLPPKPIVPHPEPARLTSTNSGSASPVGYEPALKRSNNSTETIKNALKTPGESEKKQKEIEDKMNELKFNQFKSIPLQSAGVSVVDDDNLKPNSSEVADSGGSNASLAPGGLSPGQVLNDHFSRFDRLRATELKGSADQTETISNALEKAKHEVPKPDGEYIYGAGDLIDKPSYVPNDPEYLQEDLQPTNNSQSDSESKADQRGIIIVGGKTGGTYFETIDDTLAKMNQNPQPETIQLFEQQVGALQDLSTTVQQTIQMNQQINFATTGRFRV
jgi:hypothetical protein